LHSGVEYFVWSEPLPKFEECLDRLEKIVSEMEKGDIPLERALALFEEGVKLSNSCRGELEAAEGKVEILLKQNGKLQPEPFQSEKAEKGAARK
jgi:exodeoxyribonuclease VII small subunit